MKNLVTKEGYTGVDGKFYPWYNFNNAILSRDANINFDVGARGIGKTYSWSTWAMNRWRKDHRDAWAILTRTDDEWKTMRKSFWDSDAGDGLDFRYDGILCLAREARPANVKEADWKKEHPYLKCGFFLSLSQASKYKNLSGTFQKENDFGVRSLLFDEFIDDSGKSHYRSPEEEFAAFMSVIGSVFRVKVGVPVESHVYCFSNAGFIDNAYFKNYGINGRGDFDKHGYATRLNGQVLFHVSDQPSPAAYSIGLTGKTLAYATRNEFQDSTGQFVAPKPKGAPPIYNIFAGHINGKEQWFLAYDDHFNDWLWITPSKKQNHSIPTYALDPYDIPEEGLYNPSVVKNIKRILHMNRLRFSSDAVRIAIFSVL